MTRLRVILSALLLALGVSQVSAETLAMPPRDFAAGQNEVVWGITTLANGTAFSFDFGDATPVVNGVVGTDQAGPPVVNGDRSFLAVNHTFPLAGTYNVTLTVGAEVATVTVRVFDLATMTAAERRGLNINRAIEDGLRYLWVNQSNRTTFDTTSTTNWSGPSYTALTVLAYMNHGYALPNDQSTPTGLYQKYAVQRGLNYLMSQLSQFNVAANTPNGGNPCEGIGAGTLPCDLFSQNETQGYSTSIAILPFAGSNALSRISTVAGITNGKTYGDILRRLVNGLAWGQNDSGTGRGGWYYSFNSTVSDGSTIGWNMLALLDATAAGVAPPSFVKNEFKNNAYNAAKNLSANLAIDGTFDYNADGNQGSASLGNTARVGIGLQAAFYVDAPSSDAYVVAALAAADRRWDGVAESGDYTATCGTPQNKGCAYAMFNLFKGLKLYGVSLLPSVNRAAGINGDPVIGDVDDWYADLQDYLVINQAGPQTMANGGSGTTGGQWQAGGGTNRFGAASQSIGFSCCDSNVFSITALAELILSPTALIQPDPGTFGALGLQQGNPLSVNPATNPVNTSHTVVAKVLSQGGAPIPGVTVSFRVNAGSRNAGAAFVGGNSGVSDSNGLVTKQYTDAGPAGSGGDDEIQAWIGNVDSNLPSNKLVKHWVLATIKCDADGSGRITLADLQIIAAANGQVATGPGDARDGNSDGVINVLDGRYCQLAMAKQPPQ